MAETVDSIMQQGSEQMDLAIEHLKKELTKIRTGKASAGILEGLHVDYYGSSAPLSQVANVGVADARTITIQPWEKSMLAKIEQVIFAANLGITPMNDGEIIRISVPPLTEERRRDLQVAQHRAQLGRRWHQPRHHCGDAKRSPARGGVYAALEAEARAPPDGAGSVTLDRVADLHEGNARAARHRFGRKPGPAHGFFQHIAEFIFEFHNRRIHRTDQSVSRLQANMQN